MKSELIDSIERNEALNHEGSYIIQAPAGSGKTGLLVQRILVLLTKVNDPEEILAITFTRKAASEMRDRIIQALTEAESNIPPSDAYKQVTWLLARNVLLRDEEMKWGLSLNPGRLRIMTIDSLNASLVNQMPLLSKYGSMPLVVEDAIDLYEEAANNTIDLLNDDTVWTKSVGSLVSHLDNRLDYVVSLICNMLAKRDQWLRHVADPEHPSIDRDNLESAYVRMIEGFLYELTSIWPKEINKEVTEVSTFSSAYLKQDINLFGLPKCDIDSLHTWKYLAGLLLTKEGVVRKTVTKKQGFPPKSEAGNKEEAQKFIQKKEKVIEVLNKLKDYPDVVSQLHRISTMPDPKYSDDEWEIMQALFEILRISVAQLELVFGEKGSVDFTSISQAALRSLGTASNPTDLALSLDYKISHILVDEFQDTAWAQFELIKKLTLGWQKNDGNTLFIVGDPMQSIYRFREAEVGLFLDAWSKGIGDITLKALQLKVNFRSQKGIIEWINDRFKQVLPENDNLETGAVSYVNSIAVNDRLPDDACVVYPYLEKNEAKEAEDVLQIITQARAHRPEDSIAVLVRGRTHLASIIKLLGAANLNYRAIDLEGLSRRPVIQDLLALQKALCNLSDKVAWFGVLRAPWCGLNLADLLKIAQYDSNKTVPELLKDKACLETLSDDARVRLQRIIKMLDYSLVNLYVRNLRPWLEGAWYMIGGPACLIDVTDLEDAEIFFQQLETLEKVPVFKLQTELIKAIEKLYALPNMNADESLQIMTIHKSKGLEFDTVILPGLGYRPANNDSALIKWFERPRKAHGNDLLMAPIKQTGAQANEKYQFLCEYEKQKDNYENGRLLYVATTRAKKYLHILGHVSCRFDVSEPKLAHPVSGSLLSSLWPAVEKDFQKQFVNFFEKNDGVHIDKEADDDNHNMFHRRLDKNWELPNAPCSYDFIEANSVIEETPIEFDWSGETARFIGIAVHEVLHGIVSSGITVTPTTALPSFINQARYFLLSSGISHQQLDFALSKVELAFKNIFNDAKGRWILDANHIDSVSEYSLTGLDGEVIKHVILDRTFVDTEGSRWIIDYKTGATAGDREEFMDREQERYNQQLMTYANIYRHLDMRPIKLGLYFPLFQGWREWDYND